MITQKEIDAVFKMLHLATEADRERFHRMAELWPCIGDEDKATRTWLSSTTEHEERGVNAELEPAPG